MTVLAGLNNLKKTKMTTKVRKRNRISKSDKTRNEQQCVLMQFDHYLKGLEKFEQQMQKKIPGILPERIHQMYDRIYERSRRVGNV